MSSVAGAAWPPQTPRKQQRMRGSIAVENVLRRLNDDYRFGIEIPDPTMSPSRRRERSEQDEAFARSNRICHGIKFLYFKGGDALELALESFFNEAKAASLRWVPKPSADPDTIPSATAPPKARTPGERWGLQTILISIVDSAVAEMKRSLLIPRPISAAASVGLALGPSDESGACSPASPNSPASIGSKRSFDGNYAYDQDPKRPRSHLLASSPSSRSRSPTRGSIFADALDSVPSRQRLGRPPVEWSPKSLFPRDDGLSSSSTESSGSARPPSSLFSRQSGQRSTQATTTILDGVLWDRKRASARSAGPAIPSPPRFDVAHRPTPTQSRPIPSPRQLASPSQRPASRSSQVSSPASSPFRAPATSSQDLRNIPVQGWARHDALEPAAGGHHRTALQQRLQDFWPKFPRWLQKAPLAVAWEITRICLHCKVPLEDDTLKYDPRWEASDMAGIWRSLSLLEPFRGKSFPERPAAEVFAVALNNFESRGNIVVMSAALEFNPSKTGPLFLLDMKPLRFDEGCRLTRRFGPDRFMEILIPSPTALNAPPILEGGGAEEVIAWLTQKPHSLVGRRWQAFYSKDAGYRKPAKDFRLGPDAKATFKERVHFFAEDGPKFDRTTVRSRHDIPTDSVRKRTALAASMMLDWLLQLERNEWQPHLKLFSRIQLGLSKTFPAVIFEADQIQHHEEDTLSPTGKVMNDGIGRMSRSVARKIRDALGLTDIPSAIQGRMGSAKGMWLMDVADSGDVDWIETYPSQRKWDCDWADPHHRTLEVRSVASELKPAGLNLQFLPVLEDRAKDLRKMRRAIGNRLTRDLEKQFETQKTALKRPLQFRQWVNENSNSRSERVRNGRVSFLAGLPDNKGEVLSFLLNSGFDPKTNKYAQELAWELQKQKCDILKTKLNIKVGRSAYIYMVVDFWGVLEEGEVHVGFSSKFRDESDDVSYTLLADCDVLVARSPAHFVSDVQKVRAVFKPELHALKDVIVFSAKGNIPLAEKLSGGDYDGDMAWVCWDPDLVENFVNADMPVEPDLSAYLSKDKTTFKELVRHTGQTGTCARHEAVYDMINKSFVFAMQPNYLGICTNYKERLCYHNNSVSNRAAVLLSSLVGNLVDQGKQGIIFNSESWDQLRRDYFGGRMFFEDPAYKGDHWAGVAEPDHIIDYLKFFIAKPAIDRELQSFHESIVASKRSTAAGAEDAAQWWDPDLAVYFDGFKELAKDSRSLNAVLDSLTKSISAVEGEWKRYMGSRDGVPYADRVKQVYAQWLSVEPNAVGRAGSNRLDPKTAALLEQPYLGARGAAGTSYWSLLKASAAFKAYYRANPKFVWQMAGSQLAFIKAQVTGGLRGGEGRPVLVTPLMYAGLAPDGRFVKQYIARQEGDGSEYPDASEDEDDGAEGGEWGRGDDVD